MSRYSRHITLSEIGPKGQDLISKAKVLVIGAGGLGCPALQYLAAAGIGTLGIIDFDVVEESNLQRQTLYGTSTLGINKAVAAKQRLTDLNSTICINAYPEHLTPKNALPLFEAYDVIVDGSDNFGTRYLVNDSAILTNKPLVYGAIYKFEGQVSVFNYQYGPSYRCLFPTPPKAGSVANCSEVGVLGVLPGIIGAMQANEVLKIILGFGQVLSGKLLCYDAKTSKTVFLNVPKIASEYKKIHARKEGFESFDYEAECEIRVDEISVERALQMENVQFIDIREHHEQPEIEIANCVQITLAGLNDGINHIDPEKETVVLCQSGMRSKTAVQILKQKNIFKCYSLKGGALALIEKLNTESKLDSKTL